MRSFSRVLAASILAAPLVGIGAGAVTLPEIPNGGQSGQSIELPDVVAEHRPGEAGPSDVGMPSVSDRTPDGVPPETSTPAGPGAHPLDKTPPADLSGVPGDVRNGPTGTLPEPGTGALLLAGIAGLAAMGRRRES
jgi:hypothetical protein